MRGKVTIVSISNDRPKEIGIEKRTKNWKMNMNDFNENKVEILQFQE